MPLLTGEDFLCELCEEPASWMMTLPRNLPTTRARQHPVRPSSPVKTSFVSSARNLPWMMLSCLMKISLSLLCPQGLYFRLNLSKRWKRV